MNAGHAGNQLARAIRFAAVLRRFDTTSAQAAALGQIPTGRELVAAHVTHDTGVDVTPASDTTWALVVGLLADDERRAARAVETPEQTMGRL